MGEIIRNGEMAQPFNYKGTQHNRFFSERHTRCTTIKTDGLKQKRIYREGSFIPMS